MQSQDSDNDAGVRPSGTDALGASCPQNAPTGAKYADGYPIKLVRDDIGLRLGGEGTITYEPIGDRAAHVEMLRRKLVEEAAEYLARPSIEELADVYEAVRALAEVDPQMVSMEAVIMEANAKRAERGGFEQGTVMVGHHPADGRDLLPREAPR